MNYEEDRFSVKKILTSPNYIIIIVNILVFMATDLFPQFSGTIYSFGWSGYKLVFEQGQWYRLVTAMFLHADVAHIVGNMLIIFFLGTMLEDYFGKISYVILYFSVGILADFSSIVYNSKIANDIVSIGASGAGFGLLGAVLCVLILNGGRFEGYNLRQVLLGGALTLISGFTNDGIDNIAHVGGLAAGLVVGALLQMVKNMRRTD